MKLLFIIDHLKGGGAERIIIDLISVLHGRNLDISVVVLGVEDEKMSLPNYIRRIDLNFNRVFFTGRLWQNTSKKFLIEDKIKISTTINNIDPDVIIVSPWRAFYIAQIPSIDNGKLWCWIHSEVINFNQNKTSNIFRWYKEKRRLFLEKKYFIDILNGKNIIVVNDCLKDLYSLYLPKSKIFTLMNGVSIKLITKDIKSDNEKLWDCIFVGRLSPEKQPEHAIKAFANSGLVGRMAVVGDGQMKEELCQLCHQLNISDRVDFLGWQTNPYAFIKQSKVLVLSSKTEGSPLVVAESIALNTPVVAYNINSGISYQLNISDLKHGLVENQNLSALTQKLHEVVNNPYVITDEDKQRLSIEYMADRFLEIIKN